MHEFVKQEARHAGNCTATGNGLGRKVWVPSLLERNDQGLWVVYRCKDTTCPAMLLVDAEESLKQMLAVYEVPQPRREDLRIVACAIRAADGSVFSLPAPARHHDVIRLMNEHNQEATGPDITQGFLLSNGKFCRRKPAKAIAERAGQLLKRAKDLPELYSEDVW